MHRILVAVIVLAACATRPTAGSAAPAVPVEPAVRVESQAARLGIAPLTVYMNGEVAMTMAADGGVTLDGHTSPVFTIHPDGAMIAGDGSAGRLDTDGRVVRPDGSRSHAVLDGDVLLLAGRHLHLDEHGVVQLDGPAIGGTPPRVAGIVDGPTRRTALVLVGMVLEAAMVGAAAGMQ